MPAAARFANAYENSGRPNPPAERRMDLRNNEMGRKIAADPKMRGLSPEEAFARAAKNGCVQLNPAKTAP